MRISQTLLTLAKRIYFSDCLATKVWLSHVAIWGGVFVALPFPTNSPPFYVIGHVIPEVAWGIGFALLGLYQMLTAFRHDAPTRLAGGVTGMAMWGFLAFTTLCVDWRTLALVVYMAFAVMWAWIVVRIPHECAQ